MQVWRAPARRCLLCVCRPAIPQTNRFFSQTAPVERGKPKIRRHSAGKGHKGPISEQAKRKRIRVDTVRSPEFPQLLNAALLDLQGELGQDSGLLFDEFRKFLLGNASGRNSDNDAGAVVHAIREEFIESGTQSLPGAVKRALESFSFDNRFSRSIRVQEQLVDFSNPAEWYPAARAIQRKIHLHVGPTNSGKTYQALKRLEEAKTGYYAGPLRLLAHEVYTRLSAKGIRCGLVTGDEVRVDENEPPLIYSNTVEMAPLGKDMDVGVIDEIQMIADPYRGWAWTRALLGSRVRELHLCGEERAVPLIRQLAASMGDEIEIHRYERLNPLKPMKTSLKGDLKHLQKGDCVVAFSRLAIHTLKQEIERTTGRRAAIVYGSLPPELRAQQADLFNDPNNDYDFLVATDAIGMGLNLSCKRIIFESVVRRMPGGVSRLSVSQVKQIAGRAGRYRAAMQTSAPAENIGYVTSLEDVDLPYIEECLKAEPEQITRAGLLPPDYLVQNFAYHFPPNVSFSYVLGRMTQLAKTDPRYFLCEANSDNVAHYLDEVPDLEAHDKLVILKAPINGRDPQTADLVKSFAECLAQNKRGSLLDLRHVDLNILDMPVSGDREYLRSLEFLHRSLVLYLWLSYRCGGVFTDRTLATHVKEIVEIKMHRALTEFSANAKLRKASSLRKQIALLKQMRSKQLAESGESAESEGHGVTEVSQEDSELEELKRKLKEETRKEKESRRKQWMKEKQLMEESGEQWAKERLLADETEGKAAPSTAG